MAVPQHLLETSFTPTSYRPNDPGEIGREKAFYSERNKAAQAATQWQDQMDLEEKRLEGESELAWAKFDWQKEWEPEKYYAGLDFAKSELAFRRSSTNADRQAQADQSRMAMDFMEDFSSQASGGGSGYYGGGGWNVGVRPGGGGGSSPATVYGEGYFDQGGEGYTGGGSYSDYGGYDFSGIDYYNTSGLNEGSWSDFMEG